MSIEKNIERIADALEKIADHVLNPKQQVLVAQATAAADAIMAPTKQRTSRTTKETAPVAEAPAAVEAPAAPAAPTTDATTLEDVTNTLREFVRVKGMEAAKALLLKFGAGRVSELTPEKYAEVHKALKAGLK